MREQIILQLVSLLNSNLGNRLTPELGTGIAASLNKYMEDMFSTQDQPKEATEQ